MSDLNAADVMDDAEVAEYDGGTNEAPGRTTKKAKRKVQHWFKRRELEWAHEVGGVVLLSLCGRPEMCGQRPAPIVVIPVVGMLMAESGPKDCRSCVRAHEAYLRREVARRARCGR